MPTVLVVDDDPGIIRLVSLILQTESIEVETALSGEEGLELFQNGHPKPDLILLDLIMGDMNGRDFFREVRSTGYHGPIVFCSSMGAADANSELGAQGAIDKPFHPDDLLTCVRSHLVA